MEISTTSFTTPSSSGQEPEWPFRGSEHAATTCECRFLDWIKYFHQKIVRLKPHFLFTGSLATRWVWPFWTSSLLSTLPVSFTCSTPSHGSATSSGFSSSWPPTNTTPSTSSWHSTSPQGRTREWCWCVFFRRLLEDHNLILQVVHVLPHPGQPAARRSSYKRIRSSIRLPSTSGRGAENLVLVPTFLFLRSWRPVWKDSKRGTQGNLLHIRFS